MISNSHLLQPFAYVGAGHPFAPAIGEMRAAIATSPGFAAFARLAGSPECEVHADLKAQRTEGGGWSLQRAYWCLQHEDAAGQPVSHMVLWRAGRGLRLLDFPDDPWLPTLRDHMEGRRAAGCSIEVLRYVPLRRVTFRERGPDGERIGKLKRASKLRSAHDLLAAVHEAARATDGEFTVAAATGLDEAACVFYQQQLRGTGLTSGLDAASTGARLRRVGRVHHALHGLVIPGLGEWSLDRYLRTIADDVEWIGLFAPEAQARLRPVLQWLQGRVPEPGPAVFCHGDFIASQLLLAGDAVAVTDFDAARSGERYQEIGKLLASLRYDLPHLRAAGLAGAPVEEALRSAEEAYLASYEEAAGAPLDPERLRWFRTCAEIHYLAMTFTKDGGAEDAFARTLESVERRVAAASP
jgi:aminoglycoside phosphotransferase (APT) family kinase protein